MRSSVSLVLLLAACGNAPADPPGVRPERSVATRVAPATPAQVPPEVASAQGPSGTAGAGVEAYDAVGYASWYGEETTGSPTANGERFDPAGVTAAHRTLPLGSIAEVTSLDTGRTILVRIADRGPARMDREIDLSRGAAKELGTNAAVTAVRVRAVGATPEDIAALRSGQRASSRLDAPPALLVALRKRLGPTTVAAVAPVPRRVVAVRSSAPVAPPVEPATRRPRGQFMVQVAAFSTEARALALATTLKGTTQRAGTLWRVRLGPFPDGATAKRARDAAARRGYGDATILTDP